MYAAFDRSSPSSLAADIQCLSWKGDARQGWLASGNSRKTVGVTFTELSDEEDRSDLIFDAQHDVSLERQGMRRNFNFREHSSEVCTLFVLNATLGGCVQYLLAAESYTLCLCQAVRKPRQFFPTNICWRDVSRNSQRDLSVRYTYSGLVKTWL